MTTDPHGSDTQRNISPAVQEDKGNLYGIVMMQMTIFFFVTNDTFSKMVGDALATGQMLVIRGAVALTGLVAVLLITGAYRKMTQGLHPVVLLRGLAEAISSILFLTALKQLPLANVSAILLTIPLATTAAAALFLGETVGIRRWTAIFVGFVGVMAIVRPGLEGFNFYALFALGAVFAASTRDLIARNIPKGSNLWVVTTVTMGAATLGGASLGLTEQWQEVETIHVLYLAGSALFMTLGQYFVVIAMNNGEVSVVSSFRYISMPIALTYGYLIWGEIPDALTWLGIGLILSSGIYTMWRERRVSRQKGLDAIAAKTDPVA